MNLRLCVEIDNVIRCFSFLSTSNSSFIYVPDEFVIYLNKYHNHSYCFKAFFYKSLHIYSDRYCNSKSKLFRSVQELLQEELYNVVQF